MRNPRLAAISRSCSTLGAGMLMAAELITRFGNFRVAAEFLPKQTVNNSLLGSVIRSVDKAGRRLRHARKKTKPLDVRSAARMRASSGGLTGHAHASGLFRAHRPRMGHFHVCCGRGWASRGMVPA